MASSMSLASGVLLFSSLSIMFPQAQKRLQNDTLLYACYFAGITFTLLLTKLIHYLMPDAIHACGDGSDSCQDHDSHSHDERRKLSKHRCDAEYGTMRSSESHFILHYEDYQDNNDAQNEDNTHEHSHHHHHHDPIENVVGNDPKHYLSIGIQTAIAICVHKFPGNYETQHGTYEPITNHIYRGTHNVCFNQGFFCARFKCLYCTVYSQLD